MKKPVKFLFLFTLLLTVAGAFAVSCQKEGGEEEGINGDGVVPHIEPHISPRGDTFHIEVDGTIISTSSSGYSFRVTAGSVTFNGFTCKLFNNKEFRFINDCNLTLYGQSTFSFFNRGKFLGKHFTLSGSGSITLIDDSQLSDYKYSFSAAEGYTLYMSDVKDEGRGRYSRTWTVTKSK